VRHFAVKGKLVAGAQMSDIVRHGEPHFTLDHKRPQRERVRMRLENRARRPPSLQNLVEALRSRVRRERFEVKLIHDDPLAIGVRRPRQVGVEEWRAIKRQ
jgi:hypothetical protein